MNLKLKQAEGLEILTGDARFKLDGVKTVTACAWQQSYVLLAAE